MYLKFEKTPKREFGTYKQVMLALAITLFATIVILLNLKFPHVEKQTRVEYQPNEIFSIVVSETTWDESQMPKGRRSPKGVLYKPE